MLRSATSALATLALISSSLAFGGCGGSSPPGHAGARSPSTQAVSTPAASSSDPTSVPSRCIASSGADPAAFTLCLAKHGVHLSGGGKLVDCVQSASDKATLERCLAEASR